MRPALVILHRWLGLATAAFLAVAGLTGSLLAFNHELDAWLNPALFRVEGNAARLPALEIVARAEAADPRLRVAWTSLLGEPGEAVVLRVVPRRDPVTGELPALDFDELFVHPATAEVLGRRQWGACCFGREQLLPFLYRVHYSLALPGEWGIWLMGGVGLVWIVDCLVALGLTLPARRSRADTAGARKYWQRWAPAWRIRRRAGVFVHDVHRAAGLWAWGLLLVMAVSSVSFNLHEELFEPLVNAVSPLTPSPFDTREERPPDDPIETRVSFAALVERAGAIARGRGLEGPASGVFCNPLYGICGVRLGADHPAGLGNAWMYFDSLTGAPLGSHVPGAGSAGDRFHQLQFPLHSGQIAGLPGRVVICATGLAVAVLSATGVVLWWRKRRGRVHVAARRGAGVMQGAS